MSTLTAKHPQSSIPHGTQDLDVEPDDEWKQNLRKKIEEGLQSMVQDAKNSLEYKLKQAPVDAVSRERLAEEHRIAMNNIRTLASEQFQIVLERERQERRWAAGGAVNPMWEEALKKEQQAILDTIQKPKDTQPRNNEAQPQQGQQPMRTTAGHIADVPRPPPHLVSDHHTTYSGGTVTRRDALNSDNSRSLEVKQAPFGNGQDRDESHTVSHDRWVNPQLVDEPEEIADQPRGRLEAIPLSERSGSGSPDKSSEILGRPIGRPAARSLSDRHTNSPPKIPEIWKPSISPEEDAAASRPYAIARRGSSASMKSLNSASYRPSSTNPITERPNEMDEGVDNSEREKLQQQEAQQAWSSFDRAREKEKLKDRQVPIRVEGRHAFVTEQPFLSNNQPRSTYSRPQTVEELEYQSLRSTGLPYHYPSDYHPPLYPPPSSARTDPTEHTSSSNDSGYHSLRYPRPIEDYSSRRQEKGDDYSLPDGYSKYHNSASFAPEHAYHALSDNGNRQGITSGRSPVSPSSRYSEERNPWETLTGGKTVTREYSLTMEQARQPVHVPSRDESPVEELRYQSPSSAHRRPSREYSSDDMLGRTGSIRRRGSVNDSQNTHHHAGTAHATSTTPLYTPSMPVPVPNRTHKEYDYYRQYSPSPKEWVEATQPYEATYDTELPSSLERLDRDAYRRPPLHSRPSTQSFRSTSAGVFDGRGFDNVKHDNAYLHRSTELDHLKEEERTNRRDEGDKRRTEEARRREELRGKEEDTKQEENRWREKERLEDRRREKEARRAEEEERQRQEERERQRMEEARRWRVEEVEEVVGAEEMRRKESWLKERELEEARTREEEARRKEEEIRLKEEEARCKEAEVRRKEEEAKLKEAEVRRKEEEARLKELEVRRKEEEAKRKEIEARRKEEEARRKELEVKRKEEEARIKEEEIKRREEEARRKVEEMQRKEEETRLKEEETRRKEQEIRRKEAELRAREEELARREAEAKRKELEKQRVEMQERERQRAQQEEFRKREEDIRRRAEERKRQDSIGSDGQRGGSAYPGTSPTSSSTSWSSAQRNSSTTNSPSASTDRSSTSSASRGNAPGYGWSSTSWNSSASSQSTGNRSSNTSSSTAKPSTASSKPGSMPGASPQSSTPLSEAEWARRQAEQARKQQEAFRKEQERLEMERQARAGRILTKEEVHQLFQTHERQWSRLSTVEELSWDSFPWPMLKRPTNPEEIMPAAVSAYVLSPHYPDKNKPDKDRIKEHIRRWHPDRFETKLLPKVAEGEQEKVKEGAGAVVRSLNDLLTRSNAPSIFS